MDISGPVLIKEGLWWVGDGANASQLQCNPYLLVEGDSAILFDPGSVLDAHVVLKNVQSIVPLEHLEAIVLSHQDPDLCSAVPYFEENGFSGVLCCHERAAWIIRYYGIASEFYMVNTNKYRYKLKNGSQIDFLFAPYLHFPGAIMTYLAKQKTLISGDLFGAFSETWSLYAQDDYEETMKTYHESYMPSHEILEPVMTQLLQYNITTICPQHGSVINNNVIKYQCSQLKEFSGLTACL
jgi:two-component system, cell cycle response regulator